MNDVITEADIFARYLTGKPGNSIIYDRYVSGVITLNLAFTPREERMVATLIKYPFLISLCDAGLAILSPQCTFRKRLLLMFALLETDKNFTADFINAEELSFPIARFIIRGCTGVFKVIPGIILILLMRWK